MEIDEAATRLVILLKVAGLAPPPDIPRLKDLPLVPAGWFNPSLQENIDAARTLLVQDRIRNSKHCRYRDWLRSPAQRRKKRDVNLWVFTNHEVAISFNRLLSFEPLPPVEVAKALLSHASVVSLFELWRHLHDPELGSEKKSRKNMPAPIIPDFTWLNLVTGRNNVDYIQLLYAVEMLLRAGASTDQQLIRQIVCAGDVELLKRFLSPPRRVVSTASWWYSLEPALGSKDSKPSESLLLYLSNRPELITKLLILQAFTSQNLHAAAILLAYLPFPVELLPHLYSACELATRVDDAGLRAKFFQLLATSQLLKDDPIARQRIDQRRPTSSFPTHTSAALVEQEVNTSLQLGLLLHQVVAEAGDIDSELVHLLLQHNTTLNLDELADPHDHVVFKAAEKCDMAVLNMLCDAGAQGMALSKAVPIVFNAREACGYSLALQIMKLLLERGATGGPVDHTLLVAVKEDHTMQIVRLLLEHGADANHADGAAFSIALESQNIELLEIICKSCPPDQTSTESGLLVAIDPHKYNPEALDMFLKSSSSAGAVLDVFVSKFSKNLRGIRNLDVDGVLRCFLRHGLNVDIGDGVLVSLAVENANGSLLSLLLAANPSTSSLTAAFSAAVSGQSRNFELQAMGMLLEKANSAEIGQSAALFGQTRAAVNGDSRGLDLLRHNAAVDYNNGLAVTAAAFSRSRQVLTQLLEFKPTLDTLQQACLATVGSWELSLEQKNSVFESLLVAKIDRWQRLIASRGAKVEPEAVEVALRESPVSLFELLAKTQTTSTITNLFGLALRTKMDRDRRYSICAFLGRDIPQEALSEALVMSLHPEEIHNLSLPKLLLKHGALLGHKKCLAFSLALRAESFEAVSLLSLHIRDSNTASTLFDMALNTAGLSPDLLVWTSFCLLPQWNILKSCLYRALVGNLTNGPLHTPLVDLAISKGATLSEHAELQVLLKGLINLSSHESTVWRLYNVLLEQLSFSAAKIENNELLFQCLSKFPRGRCVLRKLLDAGLSVSAQINHSLCPNLPPEPCTLLIWALFHTPKIENDVILELLTQGRAVLPSYTTPNTNVSASFACLLDQTRTPILRELIDLDPGQVLEYEISASTFAFLSICWRGDKERAWDPSEIPEGVPPVLTLRTAAFFLGNLPAYCALGWQEIPDDGMLHTAALLAMPNFVEWLLEYHDANAKVEDQFDQMIPLALACSSKRYQWSRIVNEQSDFITRQRKTIELLAAATSQGWRYRGKTVLHCALEAGVHVTRAMVQALNVPNDPDKDHKYLYTDKRGIEYSPQQWMKKFLSHNQTETRELVEVLRAFE
ncbi:hypothetical protein QBC38DRAFT_454496 [Podospora fimiseda]|uniref:Ankyrin repeat protein n=1 Tax=Podospora fimiseda TaxID=252190 RepID=A0AAN7BRN9_9PEZI|nr:hypothetical protein QBC38DRAFT_454496 [Podospora fimiseda]